MELARPGTFLPVRLTFLTIMIILTDIGVSVIIIFNLFIMVAQVSMATVCTLMKKLRE